MISRSLHFITVSQAGKGGRKNSNPLLRNDILPGNKASLCWKIKLFLNVQKTTNYEAPGRKSIWDFTMPPLSKLPLFPPKSFKCRADQMGEKLILKLGFRIENGLFFKKNIIMFCVK